MYPEVFAALREARSVRAARGEATNGGQALAGVILGVVAILFGATLLVAIVTVADDDADRDRPSSSYSRTVTERVDDRLPSGS